jgi:hypothetical protein
MQIQSLVIDSSQIELSLGKNDGGREYVFARIPFNGDDYSHHSLDQIRLASLNRVRDVIEAVIEDLRENGSSAANG